ncbi:DUF4304 domain-containing protein [Krasilnikoviella flava]|uniref:DUF4304 domain-containing protein n=1 Tax=Krasilnikoviella flava TaxID=526729 RepID=UPI0009A86D98
MDRAQDDFYVDLDATLRALGFTRRGMNWVRRSGDLYSVVNLQKSEWGAGRYVNIGFARASTTEGGWLPESKCEIRFRAGALLGSSGGGNSNVEIGHIATGPDSRPAPISQLPVTRALTDLMTAVTEVRDLPAALRDLVSDRVFVRRGMREVLDSLGS